MPANLIVPAIAAGTSLFNTAMQGITNSQSRKWNEKMYARQREDALSDWKMQNEYNSPQAQMQRLRDANLNPNLVYGEGAVANASGVPRSVDVKSWNPDVPKTELGTSLMSYYDIKLKEAQLDTLEAQRAVTQQDAVLRAYQAIKEGTDLRMTSDAPAANMFEELKKSQLQVAQSLLDKTKAETSVLLRRDEREALTNVQSLREGVERIATLRLGRELTASQKRSIDQDVELKRLEIDLRRKWNVSASDPIYIRALTFVLDKLGF